VIELRRTLNDEYAGILAQARKTIEQNEKVVERLEKKIESAERRPFWTTILTPVSLLIAVFSGGLLR
jgi:hypothetical protein